MVRRALVLGGGGPVGIAWEAGVLLALAEAGIDLTAVDHVVGTSAGAYIGARVALGHRPGDIAAPYAPREPKPADGQEASSNGAVPSEMPNLGFLFQMIQESARAGRSPAEIARDIGEFALQAKTIAEEEFIARFSSTLRSNGVGAWPARSYVCTTFDAHDGSFKIWDATSGADLACAVAASCAVPGIFPAITLAGRRYFDGGVLSTTNAHLARGYEVVFVLAVTELLTRYADRSREKKTPLEREVQMLRDEGSQVEVITFDMEALQAAGPNLMDRSRQPLALREGLRQGRAEVARLAAAMPS